MVHGQTTVSRTDHCDLSATRLTCGSQIRLRRTIVTGQPHDSPVVHRLEYLELQYCDWSPQDSPVVHGSVQQWFTGQFDYVEPTFMTFSSLDSSVVHGSDYSM